MEGAAAIHHSPLLAKRHTTPLTNRRAAARRRADIRFARPLTRYANGALLTVEFVRFPAFEKSAAGLLSEVDILDLEMHLAVYPHAGDLIPGGRGLRKLRRPAKGRGKRAGARVIYYHVNAQHLILHIVAYAKNEQEDLDRRQLQILAQLVKTEFP